MFHVNVVWLAWKGHGDSVYCTAVLYLYLVVLSHLVLFFFFPHSMMASSFLVNKQFLLPKNQIKFSNP